MRIAGLMDIPESRDWMTFESFGTDKHLRVADCQTFESCGTDKFESCGTEDYSRVVGVTDILE